MVRIVFTKGEIETICEHLKKKRDRFVIVYQQGIDSVVEEEE
jgi:alcohol dehydrogenase YqhD (iron-dependent ADH family)